MTDREKLADLIEDILDFLDWDSAYDTADYLLESGVTFATDNNVGSKWIPVTERLPEKEGTYIVHTLSGCVTTARFYPERDLCNYRGEFIRHELGRFHRNATHWMPLPEPPKEVE